MNKFFFVAFFALTSAYSQYSRVTVYDQYGNNLGYYNVQSDYLSDYNYDYNYDYSYGNDSKEIAREVGKEIRMAVNDLIEYLEERESREAKAKAIEEFNKRALKYGMSGGGVFGMDEPNGINPAMEAAVRVMEAAERRKARERAEREYQAKSTKANQNSINEQKLYDLQVAANDAYNRKEYKKASSLYARAYSYKTDKLDLLYYSAVSAINGGDYPTALNGYLSLFQKGYTGQQEKYFVTYKKRGETVEVSENEYQKLRNSKKIIDRQISLTESLKPSIIKSIALLYNNLGYKESAYQFAIQALESSPNDIDLILTAANISYTTGEMAKFSELVKKALALDPNNAVLYYNLGSSISELGEKTEAKKYYNKAIELDPNMQYAYINLVSLILEPVNAIVEEMNSLGRSTAEDKKYDELNLKRISLYMECVPILKKLINIDARNNLQAIETLKDIYAAIGDNKGTGEMDELLKKYR